MVRRSKRKMILPPGDGGGGGGGGGDGGEVATPPAPAASRHGRNIRNRNRDTTKVFIYTGQHGDDIPQDITHVRVDSSVTEIVTSAFFCNAKLVAVELNEGLENIGSQSFSDCKSLETIILPSTMKDIGTAAFSGCVSLVTVQLNEGLESIGPNAFSSCKSLESVTFPSSLKDIGMQAFAYCDKMVRVKLNEGLEDIAVCAFEKCGSLESITIPTTVKVLHPGAFSDCKKMVNVTLNEGLESIHGNTFQRCVSLEFLSVPSTVKYIEFDAFKECERLLAIEFSDEFEEFVSETSHREWWHRGNSEHILEAYSFLCLNCIAKRFRKLKPLKWRQAIKDMLCILPIIDALSPYEDEDRYYMRVNHCKIIDSKLIVFEKLADIATLIELALMVHQLHSCGAAVIIPNVLSFLMVDKWPVSASEI